jgi:hypothetical protein
MGEMLTKRVKTGRALPKLDEILNDFYTPRSPRKHKSPTKRLISLKNSTSEHKKRISNTISKGDYS